MPSFSEIKAVCWKNENEKYMFSKYVQRYASLLLTKICIGLGLKSNAVTFLSLLSILGATFVLFIPVEHRLLLAATLIYLYNLLDHVDGEVARYNNHAGRQKPALDGAYFDILVHQFSINVFYLSAGLYLTIQFNNILYMVVGTILLLGFSNFPRQVLALIILQNQFMDPFFLEKVPKGLLDNYNPVGKKSSNRIKALLAEFIFFPGCLVTTSVVLVLESLLSLNYLLMRFYLIGLAMLILVNTVRLSHRFIKQLSMVSPTGRRQGGVESA